MLLTEIVPNFKAETTTGPIDFHEYIEGSWAILFSHPADHTPVCTTELGEVGKIQEEFKKRGVKVVALSLNDVDAHKDWIQDIEAYTPGSKVDFPIIADPKREVAMLYGMLDPDEKDAKGLPLPARAVFVVGPDKRLTLHPVPRHHRPQLPRDPARDRFPAADGQALRGHPRQLEAWGGRGGGAHPFR